MIQLILLVLFDYCLDCIWILMTWGSNICYELRFGLKIFEAPCICLWNDVVMISKGPLARGFNAEVSLFKWW